MAKKQFRKDHSSSLLDDIIINVISSEKPLIFKSNDDDLGIVIVALEKQIKEILYKKKVRKTFPLIICTLFLNKKRVFEETFSDEGWSDQLYVDNTIAAYKNKLGLSSNNV